MTRGKSDISNMAIRIFLQNVGEFYDKSRNLDVFKPSNSQKEKLLKFFSYKCCFCDVKITVNNMHQDHLIPMNKTSLGLHAWGNVVPCCRECNKNKHHKNWLDYLKFISSGNELTNRKRKIQMFVKKYNYKPSLNLKEIANNLYQDVGEVSLKLIHLRYKQAEKIINNILKK